MLTIVVCVGSSCYVRGAERLAETFERLISQYGLAARVLFTGAFCMERCSLGVSVRVADRVYAGLDPAQAEAFFAQEVLPCILPEAA